MKPQAVVGVAPEGLEDGDGEDDREHPGAEDDPLLAGGEQPEPVKMSGHA